MAKILCQAKQLKVTIPEKTYADDAEIAQWAKGYVYACQEAGIMEGSGDNFNPRDNATRADVYKRQPPKSTWTPCKKRGTWSFCGTAR